jgi:hypothetical protein
MLCTSTNLISKLSPLGNSYPESKWFFVQYVAKVLEVVNMPVSAIRHYYYQEKGKLQIHVIMK